MRNFLFNLVLLLGIGGFCLVAAQSTPSTPSPTPHLSRPDNDKLLAVFEKSALAENNLRATQDALTQAQTFRDEAQKAVNMAKQEVIESENLPKGTDFNVDLRKPAGEEVTVVSPPPAPKKEEGKK